MSEARKSGKKNAKNGASGNHLPGLEIPSKIWVVGGGQMGGVIVRQLVSNRSGVRPKVRVADPNPEVMKAMKMEEIEVDISLASLMKKEGRPDMVVLAVKPGIFTRQDSELSESLGLLPEGVLALSVMAGVPLKQLRNKAPGLRWIRAMTNLALSAGRGMTLLAASNDVSHGQQTYVYGLFSGMGRALWLPEESFDAATAIAGSGPGILALISEALADGGVREGLSRETATLLSSWALLGTGALLAERGNLPELLKARVASPSGITIEGLAALERLGVRGAIIDAVRAMAARSREISQGAS